MNIDEDKVVKAIFDGKIVNYLVNLIILKSRDEEGNINTIGKTIIGISGSLILLFFFMVGYSFLYGVYFGNHSQLISIFEMGLNIVPIETKFVISIGVLILILTSIFIIPIKNLFFKIGIVSKLLNLGIIIFCAMLSLSAFKIIFIWQIDSINSSDIPLIMLPIYIPLIFFGCGYTANSILNTRKTRIIFSLSTIITLIILIIIIKATNITNFTVLFFMTITFLLVIPLISSLLELIPILRNIDDNTKITDVAKSNSESEKGEEKKFDLIYFAETMAVIVISFLILLIVSIPTLYASLGTFYGTNYVKNNKQVITYLQDNLQKQKIGNIVGFKDGNYYISEYPNKNLIILKSAQAVVETRLTGWYNINNKWYYFDSNGLMLQNTITPDGFKVDEYGVWVQ